MNKNRRSYKECIIIDKDDVRDSTPVHTSVESDGDVMVPLTFAPRGIIKDGKLEVISWDIVNR